MKNTLTCLLLAFICVTQAVAISPDETKSAPIPFDEIGARATADYSGDAIGIRVKPEGVELRTGFQKLEALVTNEGMHLHSTEGAAGSLKLTAAALGRTGFPGVALPPVGHVSVVDQTVCFTRPGLVEEYSVSVDGLRQDFVVAQAPGGSGELCVELVLTGATAEPAAEGVKLTLNGSGRELAYNRLQVTDARGQLLSASLRVLTPTRLAVRVEDAGAVYPVRIDPTFSDADWVNTLNPGIPGVGGISDATVHASVVDSSGNLYIGGFFFIAGSSKAQNFAKWDGSTWSSPQSGLNGRVYALAATGTDIYAGGEFTYDGENTVFLKKIAKWNGSAWSALGPGIEYQFGGPSRVYSLAVSGSNLYAGGDFDQAGGVSANRIARWNGSTWSSLGSGLNGSVNALATTGATVYASGAFGTAGGVSAIGIAKWNGSTWSALGSGMNGFVNALAVTGSDLYAGGFFSTAGGVTAHSIAKWNGSAWSAVGAGMNGTVEALAVSGTTLYAGGSMSTLGGVSASFIAKWNGSAWSALGPGVNATVRAIAVSGTNVFAGGDFKSVSGGTPNACLRIAKWSGTTWSALGSGMNGGVRALVVSGTDIYAGGEFTTAGEVVSNYIAKWNGSAWSALGSGMSNHVYALAVSGTTLYAGGRFTTAGGISASRIAKWDGATWSSLGFGVSNTVNALAVVGADLYAGGSFSTAGGVNADRIAKWNGSAWSALGAGVNDTVHALAGSGTELYAGGDFTTAGGVSANRIARWSGSTWSPLSSGFNGKVSALVGNPTSLYAGGDFTTAGGVPASRVARWNGTVWSALGTGIDSSVSTLVANGVDLYAGGAFTSAGGVAVRSIARWNGSTWTGLGSGVSPTIHALAIDANGQLVLGGVFELPRSRNSKLAPYIVQANVASYPTPIPEIEVSGDGQPILNGDMIPNTTDGTEFGNVGVPSGIQLRTFAITNLGAATLNLTGQPRVVLSGSTAFTVTTQPAASTIVAGGGVLTFQISFTPNALGTHNASVSIANSDTDENPYTFSIRGTGFEPLVPEIVVGHSGESQLTSNQSWVNVGLGTTTFSIMNIGNAPLTLTGTAPSYVTLTGSGAFTVTTQPDSATIPTGGTRTFSINFNPPTFGTFGATISIASNDADENPFNFSVQGTVVPQAPELDVEHPVGTVLNTNPSLIDFGTTPPGGAGVSKEITVRNTGNIPLTGLGATMAGPSASEFNLNLGTLGSSLAPGGSATLSITFIPSQSGLRQADLMITSNDADENPITITTRGRGTASYFFNYQINQTSASANSTQILTVPFATGQLNLSEGGSTQISHLQSYSFSNTCAFGNYTGGTTSNRLVTLNGTASTGNLNQAMNFLLCSGGGASLGTSQPVTWTLSAAGSSDRKLVTLIIGSSSSSGASWMPGTFTLGEANDPPVAIIQNPPDAIFTNTTLILNALPSYDVDATGFLSAYGWDLDGDGDFDDASGPVLSFAPGGYPPSWTSNSTVSFSLRVTDNSGSTHSLTLSRPVNPSPQNYYNATFATAGLTGADAAANATPQNDGVPNLLKYAFNMNLAAPEVLTFTPGGSGGLPAIAPVSHGGSSWFRYSFRRRRFSGLTYTPQMSANIANPASWTPITAPPVVTPVDATWETVTYDQPYDAATTPQNFGRVQVTLPP